MTVEEALGPPVEIWPDNLAAINVFIAMSTQWRIGMAGPTGLDYAALPAVMDVVDIDQEARRAVFNDLRSMEEEALKWMHTK